MKRTKIWIALFVVMALLGTSCEKQSTVGNNRLEKIRERGYLEVATEPYFAPYEFIDPTKQGQDQYVGSDMEMAKYIADELGVQLRIVPLEFGAVLSGITDGKFDLAISALGYTPARAEAMNMSDGYYFSEGGSEYGLLIRTEDAQSIRTVGDVADRVVVAQSGSLQEMYVNDQVPEYKEFKRVSSTNDAILMVQEKKADVCSVSVSMAQLYIQANPDAGVQIMEGFRFVIDKATDGTRIGIPKGEDELTARINEIIKELRESGTFEKWHEQYQEYAVKLGL